MKNLLDDPDVMALYKGLQNNKYEDIDDYLTSFPETENYSNQGGVPRNLISEEKLSPLSKKIFWNGEEITSGIEYSDDYGL